MKTLFKKAGKEITQGELTTAEEELKLFDFQIKEEQKKINEKNTYLDGKESQLNNLSTGIQKEQETLKNAKTLLSTQVENEKKLQKEIETLTGNLKTLQRDMEINKNSISKSEDNLEKSIAAEKEANQTIKKIQTELQDESSALIKKGNEYNKKLKNYEQLQLDFKEQERNKEFEKVPYLVAADSKSNYPVEETVETRVETVEQPIVQSQPTPQPIQAETVSPVEETVSLQKQEPVQQEVPKKFVIKTNDPVQQVTPQPVVKEIVAPAQETEEEECPLHTLKQNIISSYEKGLKKPNGEKFVGKNGDSLLYEFSTPTANGDKTYVLSVSNTFVLTVFELKGGYEFFQIAKESNNNLVVNELSTTSEQAILSILQTVCLTISYALKRAA